MTLINSQLPPCSLIGNADALRMLFYNLLENALRYTEPGGKVVVDVHLENARVEIKVADTGIGIPGDCLPHIFERFYRVDKSRSRSSGGSGLGLAIARGIAQAHGGDISVTSKLKEGTTFIAYLPVAVEVQV